MAITFTNASAAAVGLYDKSGKYHVIGGINGSATLDPSAESQVIVDIYVQSGAGKSVDVPVPENTVAPAITGIEQVDETLTTTNGTWVSTPAATYTRAWQRSDNGTTGWSAISGATALTYKTTSADEDKYIRCVVTATNISGSATAESNVVGPIAE